LWAKERWLGPRCALISDRLEARRGGGWPLIKRQVPLTPFSVSSVEALTLGGDFQTLPALPVLASIRDGSEVVAQYELKLEDAGADRVIVEERNGSAGSSEKYDVLEEYDVALFDLLKKAEDSYLDAGDGLAYLLDLALAGLTAVRRGWIKIEPAPQWLMDLEDIHRRLRGLDLDRARSWLGEPKPGRSIAWEGQYSRLRLGGDASSRGDLTPGREAVSDLVLHAPLPWIKQTVSRVRCSPDTAAGREEILVFLIERLKEYGREWKLEPHPLILHPWLRAMGRALGHRYDLERLDHKNLATMLTQGVALAVGWRNQYAIVVVDGNKAGDAVLIGLLQGGIERVMSLDTSEWSEVPGPGEDRDEWLAGIQYKLWDEVGWVNYVNAVDKRVLTEARPLAAALFSSSFWGMLRAAGPAFRLGRLSRAERFAVWPSEAFKDIGKWIAREGRLPVIYRLSQVPFRRRRPRSRGMLYVKETAAAVVLLILIATALALL
jgi:hypothetical protein